MSIRGGIDIAFSWLSGAKRMPGTENACGLGPTPPISSGRHSGYHYKKGGRKGNMGNPIRELKL